MDAPWTKYYEEGVPKSIVYPSWSLPDLLDATAREFPDKRALTFFADPKLPPSHMTYGQLRDATLRFATALHELGVRKGDRVAVMLPNCPQFPVAFFGLLRLGAIAVNTNPLYVAREMKEQFHDSGAETVVLLNAFFPRLAEIRQETQIKRVIVVDDGSTDDTAAWLASAVLHGWLVDGATVVVERSTRGGTFPWPVPLKPLRERRYGETTLHLGRCYGPSP
jgi:acyl-CoA synthetase (AMP-forming)/AMP-acid ligase II